MKIERKNEEFGSFTIELSEEFERLMRRAAEKTARDAGNDPAETEKLLENYSGVIESSIALFLEILQLTFSTPEILPYVLNTINACQEPLLNRLKRDAGSNNVN